jgi:NAD-dependent dihydropyrimidine dehydrogenase PreA subunit
MYVPMIDRQKCCDCAECLDVCPADVIAEQDDRIRVLKPEECIGCDSCVLVCPEEAIIVEEV